MNAVEDIKIHEYRWGYQCWHMVTTKRPRNLQKCTSMKRHGIATTYVPAAFPVSGLTTLSFASRYYYKPVAIHTVRPHVQYRDMRNNLGRSSNVL